MKTLTIEKKLKRIQSLNRKIVRNLDKYHTSKLGSKLCSDSYARYEKFSIEFDEAIEDLRNTKI